MRAVLVVKDDDFGFEDDVLGVAEVDLADAECIQHPRHPVTMAIKLAPGDSLGNEEDPQARNCAVAPVCNGQHCCTNAVDAIGFGPLAKPRTPGLVAAAPANRHMLDLQMNACAIDEPCRR